MKEAISPETNRPEDLKKWLDKRGIKLILFDLDDTLIDTNTVSYTHLRAHETVLDLVCRLLLEKKNKTTQHLVK